MQLKRVHPLVLIAATAALFLLAAGLGCLEPECSTHDDGDVTALRVLDDGARRLMTSPAVVPVASVAACVVVALKAVPGPTVLGSQLAVEAPLRV